MLIIWGTYERVHDVGAIERFCPVCRQLSPFRVGEFIEKTHLYYIPLSSKRSGAFTSTCSACDAQLFSNANPFDDVEESSLAASGLPRSAGADERRTLERAFHAGLMPEAREFLLREPFHVLAAWAEIIKASGSKDAKAVLAVCTAIAAFCTFIAAVVTMLMNPGLIPSWLSVTIIISSMLIVAASAIAVSRGWRRDVNRRIVPLLVRSLQPLEPSLDELSSAVHDARQRKLAIGKAIDPQQLCAQIMAADARDLQISTETTLHTARMQE